jgi:ElaB/YqjD/DUF883 family membrane-anchored ribosome-binding protein
MEENRIAGVSKDEGIGIADRAATLAKHATTTGEKATWVVQGAAKKVGAQAVDIGGRATDGARSLAQYVAEQPLTSVVIAAALGYGLARLLHAERRLPLSPGRLASGTPGVSAGDAPVAMPLGAV